MDEDDPEMRRALELSLLVQRPEDEEVMLALAISEQDAKEEEELGLRVVKERVKIPATKTSNGLEARKRVSVKTETSFVPPKPSKKRSEIDVDNEDRNFNENGMSSSGYKNDHHAGNNNNNNNNNKNKEEEDVLPPESYGLLEEVVPCCREYYFDLMKNNKQKLWAFLKLYALEDGYGPEPTGGEDTFLVLKGRQGDVAAAMLYITKKSNAKRRKSVRETEAVKKKPARSSGERDEREFREQRDVQEREVRGSSGEVVHVFVDVSNVLVGAKRSSDGKSQMQTACVYWKKFLLHVERGRKVIAPSAIVGSLVHDMHKRFFDDIAPEYFKSWEERKAGDKEMHVDKILQWHLLQCLFGKKNDNATIVLCTGDGNDQLVEEGGHGFPDVVRKLLEHGFRVELVSWRFSISPKYHEINHPNFSIRYLDPYRGDFVFHSNH